MKKRPKNIKSVVSILLLVLALAAAADFFGIGTSFSGTRTGYAGRSGWRSWSAHYKSLNGSMKHTIRPKNTPDVLHVEVVTEKGTISIEMKDADGNVVFDEEEIKTASFDVEVPGKVVVRIKAKKHRGSFDIS